MRSHTTLNAGEWVEVLSREEIERTLDRNARLEGMPFMPEMVRYCGRRYRVYKRAHRTCDTVDYIGGRHLDRTVHLEGLRCDGEGHGGCHALCLLFWKEAWLRRVPGPGPDAAAPAAAASTAGGGEPDLLAIGTRKEGEAPDCADPTYVCQATQLLEATVPLRRSDLGPYLEDLTSGNVTVGELVAAAGFVVFTLLAGGRYGVGTPLRWAYDVLGRLRGRWPFPEARGKIPRGGKTPSRKLDLQAGELVRVRDLPDILETVDENLRNRGMGFHSEMVQFTGKTFRVARRIEKIVHEKTGKMIHMKNDVVILEDAVCRGKYINNCRRFCPRSVYLYFREIWLERAAEPAALPAESAAAPARSAR